MELTNLTLLQQTLQQQYGITAHEIVPAKRGFYGETWRVVSESNKTYFAKLVFVDCHKGTYAHSFGTLDAIIQRGYPYAISALPTQVGALYTTCDDAVLGVYPYVEGENREDYPICELFERLARLYHIPYDGMNIERIHIDDSVLGVFDGALEQLKQSGMPQVPMIARQLDGMKRQIDGYAERLCKAVALCKQTPYIPRITHGDAGGNCILNGERFVIIDWDDPVVSAIERDAWFFMHVPQQANDIAAVLTRYGIEPPNVHRCCFFAYRAFFYYAVEYIQTLLCCADGRRNEIANQMVDYLQNSWIHQQYKYYDTVIL